MPFKIGDDLEETVMDAVRTTLTVQKQVAFTAAAFIAAQAELIRCYRRREPSQKAEDAVYRCQIAWELILREAEA